MAESKPELELNLNQQQCNGNKEPEPVDRISHFQNAVILRILSFLNTKEAVRTAVLSSKWRHHWTGLTSLFLHCGHSRFEDFRESVNNILLKCTSSTLSRVYISCPYTSDFSSLYVWLSFVQSRNIRKLDIWVGKPNKMDGTQPMTPFILTCNTLVSLVLGSYLDLRIPKPGFCLPHLKFMRLFAVFPDQEDVLVQLLSSCPKLEELHLIGLLGYVDGLTFNIPGLTLKRLNLDRRDDKGNDESYSCDFFIDVCKLECLTVHNRASAFFAFVDPHSFRNVSVQYDSGDLTSLFLLFSWIYNTKLLLLHSQTLELLGPYFPGMHALFPSIGLFRFLTCLIMHVSASCGWGCLNFIHLAHSLKTLILDMEKMRMSDRPHIIIWEPPGERIPVCLKTSLKRIGMRAIQGRLDELLAVGYLLKNAEVLESMTIGYSAKGTADDEVTEIIHEFPRASDNCKVYVYKFICYEIQLPKSRDDIGIRSLSPKPRTK